MGIDTEPAGIQDAIEAYVARRKALEEEYGVTVGRALEDEVRRGVERVLGSR